MNIINPATLVAAGAMALLPVAASAADKVPFNPSAETICLLYYSVAKEPAPLDDFAAASTAVQQASEFDRDKATDAEKAKLQAQLASLGSVTTIRVGINMSMGEYDSGRGEYDLTGFTPDQYLQYYCFNKKTIRLRFDNAEDAQSWVLPAADAEAALKKNDNRREVTADATVELTGVDDDTGGDPPMLVGKVTEVELYGQFNHAPLGRYTVKP